MTQDQFLNLLRKSKIKTTVYLINGIRYEGTIISFDQFTVILENEKQQVMLYKSALSAVIPSRKINIKTTQNQKPHTKQEQIEKPQEVPTETQETTEEEWYTEERQE